MSRTFVDAIVPDGGRKYSLTANADGTTSIEDVTEYLQAGDKWGAAEANEIFAAAEAAEATAAEAKTTAEAAQTTADGKVSKSGDTMTGVLEFPNVYNGVAFRLNNSVFILRSVGAGLEIVKLDSTGTSYIDAPFSLSEEGSFQLGGGTFTGNVAVPQSARNGWYVYNSAIYASGGTSTVSSVDLRFIRK